MEAAIVVGKALAQVKVGVVVLAVLPAETSSQNTDGPVTLDGDVDILGRVGKAGAVPCKVTCRVGSSALGHVSHSELRRTVVVANMIVQVDLRVDPLTVDSLEAATEDGAVLETDLLGSCEEVAGHCDKVVFLKSGSVGTTKSCCFGKCRIVVRVKSTGMASWGVT